MISSQKCSHFSDRALVPAQAAAATATPWFSGFWLRRRSCYGLPLMPVHSCHCLIVAAVLWAAMATPAAADPDCKCRFAGERYGLGTVMCIRGKLARCEMYLNNSSWKTIADACPQVSAPLPPLVDAAAIAALAGAAHPRLAALAR